MPSATESTPCASLFAIESSRSNKNLSSILPSMVRTAASLTAPPEYAIAWSSKDNASRILPCAASEIRRKAGGSAAISSAASTRVSCPAICTGGNCLRLNCRQRESTVTGTFCGSVVARMNSTCPGGSSRVLSIALNAWFESWWTSSIMYTL